MLWYLAPSCAHPETSPSPKIAAFAFTDLSAHKFVIHFHRLFKFYKYVPCHYHSRNQGKFVCLPTVTSWPQRMFKYFFFNINAEKNWVVHSVHHYCAEQVECIQSRIWLFSIRTQKITCSGDIICTEAFFALEGWCTKNSGPYPPQMQTYMYTQMCIQNIQIYIQTYMHI